MEAVPPPRPRVVAATAVEEGNDDADNSHNVSSAVGQKKHASLGEEIPSSPAQSSEKSQSRNQDQGVSGKGDTKEKGGVVTAGAEDTAAAAASARGAWCAQVIPPIIIISLSFSLLH